MSAVVGFDRAVASLKARLLSKLSWLNNAHGRAQRLTKIVDGKQFEYPAIYKNDGTYLSVNPDSLQGNFSFVLTDDPQEYLGAPNSIGRVKIPTSIVFWFNLAKIYPDPSDRNIEALKLEIIRLLNDGGIIDGGAFRLLKIFEQPENIYKGFSLREVDTQYLMHPFAGFRFEGELTVYPTC